MKIALIFPPAWATSYPPIGIACLAAVLRKRGMTVEVQDWNIELWHYLKKRTGSRWNRKHPLYWDNSFCNDHWKSDFGREQGFEAEVFAPVRAFLKKKVRTLGRGRFHAVGLSLFDTTTASSRHLVKWIREEHPGIRLFVGGPSVADLIHAHALERWFADVDLAVAGEGEIPVQLMVDAWKKKLPIPVMPGFALPGPGGRLLGGASAPPAPMEQFVPPDFSDFPLKKYSGTGLPLVAGRGCVNRCAFCSECSVWKPWRFRSGKAMADEMEVRIRRHRVRTFHLLASVFNGKPELVREFCEEILRRGLRVHWMCNMIFTPKLDSELIRLMARAGCVCMVFGLESGSDSVLKKMGKRFTADLAARIIRDAFVSGIRTSLNVIVGFPGETDEDFMLTVNFLKKMAPAAAAVNVTICTLARGSTLHEHPERFGILRDEHGALAVREEGGKWVPFRDEWKHILDWATEDLTNTPSVRQRRHDLLLELIENFKIRGNTPFDALHSNGGKPGEYWRFQRRTLAGVSSSTAARRTRKKV